MRLAATDRAVIRQMAAEGATDPQIATTIGVSSQTIFCFRKREGIPSTWKPQITSEHGTFGRYCAGCRCDACTLANRVKCREYYRENLSLAARARRESVDSGRNDD